MTAALPANTPALKRAFRRMVMNLYYAGTLKHSEKSILMTLATFMGRGGLYPSHEAIAEASNYAVRTVIRALERAYELGIGAAAQDRQEGQQEGQDEQHVPPDRRCGTAGACGVPEHGEGGFTGSAACRESK